MRNPHQTARSLAILATLFGLVATACTEPAREQNAGHDDATCGASTDSTDVSACMEAARIPGLSLARLEKGEISAVELLGVADANTGSPVNARTMFEAASLSKPVFASIVLRLAERGELDLDQPLYELWSSDRLSHDPRSERLTARLVLSHQTGLPNWGDERADFDRDPGERFGYSGEGYVYLQKVLEKVTGISLDELAEREIFEPLGMSDSRFSWADGEQLQLARPHDEVGKPLDKRPSHEANAAASLYTTAGDYALFVAALLHGSILGTDSWNEAMAPISHPEPDDDATPEQATAARRLAWGLGWGMQLGAERTDGRVDSTDDAILWHWGDNGPFKAFVAFRPATGSGIVYFANSANGLAIGPQLVAGVVGPMAATFEWLDYPLVNAPGFAARLEGLAAEQDGRFAEAISHYQDLLLVTPDSEETQRRIEWLTDFETARAQPRSVDAELLQRYVGSYGPRTLSVEGEALYYQRQGGERYRLLPLSETLFALEKLTIFRIEMVTDDRGEPTMLRGHYVAGHSDESRRGPADG